MSKMRNSFKPSNQKGPIKKGIKNLDFKALFRILKILFKAIIGANGFSWYFQDVCW